MVTQEQGISKKQSKAFLHAQGKDVIIWGPCSRLGGPFQSQWQEWLSNIRRNTLKQFTLLNWCVKRKIV